MSLVLAILEQADLVQDAEAILDAEERGFFLPQDLEAANAALSEIILDGYHLDIVSLSVLIRDFMEDNNVVAVAHCVALVKTLLEQYEQDN